MTYSVESLLFKAAAGVVNTAARAANSLLEVMYPPRYDVAHIWDELAAPADPHPAGAADPAGPRDAPPSPPAGSLTWRGWAVPAILEVLAEHRFYVDKRSGESQAFAYDYSCVAPMGGLCRTFECRGYPGALDEWSEHVADLIADRIACDPTRAALALTSLQKQ